MLQEGIQASFVRGQHSVLRAHYGCLSSQSPLRLQQLEHMGFPTEQAAVALVAVAHCCVSLPLWGGWGGELVTEILVTQGRSCAPTPKGPGSPRHMQTLR